MERKYIKQIITILIGVVVLLLLSPISKPQPYTTVKEFDGKPLYPLNNGCLIFYTPSQHGDINLPIGTIFGYPTKSGEKVYDIIR